MALRYSQDFLLFLRDSPLCVKPDDLPPVEEWMGATPEQLRAQQQRTISDRTRGNDYPAMDQSNRRPGIDRLSSRNSANPEDIIFGPPRMAFASSRGNSKGLEHDGQSRDGDTQSRFSSFRNNRGPDGESERTRDGRHDNRRRFGDSDKDRGERDQDSEGWRMVKPRKSFGTEGAERFHGKMGGNYRDERRPPRDKDTDAPRDRSTRTFDSLSHDKDAPDEEDRARNGSGRNRAEGWRNEGDNNVTSSEKRRDRNKSWRDRDDFGESDRNGGRPNDRRWGRDRDQRVERDPEWMDEPAAKPREAHTQQDFQKWMEQMKKAKGTSSDEKGDAAAAPSASVVSASDHERSVAQPAPTETGPDKFFMAFGGSISGMDAAPAGEQKEAAPKPKTVGKSSRFTSFFSQPQEVPTRSKAEPAMRADAPGGQQPPPMNPLMAALAAGSGQPPEEERHAFQQLLAKLQKQSMSATPPAPGPFPAPPQGQPTQDGAKISAIHSPEPFHQYGGERREASMGRPPSQNLQDILAPRPQPQGPRPDQLLQDLVNQHQRTSSQGSTRPESARNNSNTEFLMNLMRAGPGAGQPHNNQGQMKQGPPPAQMADREAEFHRGPANARGPPQQPPPGFPMDERFHNHERDVRPQPPTQILQRPPPPGLNQMAPVPGPEWLASPTGQMPPPPPQNRGPMLPPPGLVGNGPNRPPPHMFPPNFSPGGMMPPDGPPGGPNGPGHMGGMPPRNMPPPPPGFYNGPPPPHGFMPPGLVGFNGGLPGMDSPGGYVGPFEGRGGGGLGGGNGRGNNFGRP